MKYLSYIFLLTSVLFGATACQKALDVPLPEHKKRLVVNAFLTSGKSIDVYLTRSFGPLEDVDKLDLFVRGATVEILSNGEVVSTLTMQDTTIYKYDWAEGDSIPQNLSKYSSDFSPKPNTEYELKVSHSDYEAITAKTHIPDNPSILSAELKQNVARSTDIDGYTSNQSLLTVEFQDEAGIGNQYRMKVAIEYEYPDFPGEPVFQELYAGAIGPVTGTDNSGAFTTNGPWLSDEGKDGQTIKEDFVIYLPNAWDEGGVPEPLNIHMMYIELYNANTDSYEYLRKLKQQEDNASNGFEFFPPEAIVVYSNVENGYGIFGGLGLGTTEFVP
ncbi:MAG: DUF4249 domain-containing protein [Bacteroidota bacterium]